MDNQRIKIINEKKIHSGFFDVVMYELQFKLFAGDWSPVIHRELVKRRTAVVVLLYDPVLDKVVLIEQFRMGAIDDPKSTWLLEVVAGLVESGEALAEVATRESLEEANCVLKKVIPIGAYYTSPGGSTEFTHAFCGIVDASKAGGIHGLDHEAEDIKVHVISSEDAIAKIKTGEIRSVDAIVTLQWLQLNKDRL